MRPDVQMLFNDWEGFQEAYDDAKRDFDEAAIQLERMRRVKEDFLTHILFGVA